MSDSKFEIIDNVLKKYTGTDKEVIIPEGVIEIASSAFTDAHFMESITFPKSLKRISYHIVATDVYGYEYKLKRVNIDSLDTWLNIDFGDDKANLLGVTDDTELYIDNKLVTDLVIPNKYKRIKVYAFYGYKKLKSLKLEEGVEVIEKGVFCRSGIEKVELPESLKSIGEEGFSHFFLSPFMYCYELKEINIPKCLKKLPEHFVDGSKISSIVLPDGLEVIPNSAFNNCKELKEFNIPCSVNRIEADAFSGCESITELIFPDTVKFLGSMNLKNLRKIVLPEDWEFIGNRYWSLFEYLETEHLEMNLFDNAYYVGSRKNPYQVLVKVVDPDIFYCNVHPDCVYICGQGAVTKGSAGFAECKNITSISLIDNKIKRIEPRAFASCPNLEKIELPISYGTLAPEVYKDSPKLIISEFGIKDKVVYLEKEVKMDDEEIKESFSISKEQICLTSIRKINNEEIVTRLHKNNTVSDEHLIDIYMSLSKCVETDEESYRNNKDVYKVRYFDYEDTYLMLNESAIIAIYSLVNYFIGQYFLINKDAYKPLSKRYDQRFDYIHEQIMTEYGNLSLDELTALLKKYKEEKDYVSYTKVNLLVKKIKNDNKWERNYEE